MRRAPFAVLASLLAVAIFAGANLAAFKWLAPVRGDFTQNRLYSLSSSARTVVGRLVEPVDLELVISGGAAQQFPALRAHGERVRELLHEIAARSRGKVRIRETDPAPFSEEEDRVAEAGLRPAPTSAGGDPLYFGVIGRNSVDDAIALPYLAPERDALLEYDLVRLIAQLDDPAPPKVAVISSFSSLQGDGKGEGDAFVLREMARAFDVEPVDDNFRALPAGTDVLLLVHPPELTPWQSYVVDQFLLRKGRALIALDPVSRVGSVQMRPQLSSSLPGVEAMLGASVPTDAAAADRQLALPVEVDAGGGRREVMGQPLYSAPPPALMSRADPVTADLSRPVHFGAPGRIMLAPKENVTATRLIETTSAAALIAAELAAADPGPRGVAEAYRPGAAALTLAARISGELTTAFPDGPPAVDLPDDPALHESARREAAKVEPRVAISQTPAEVILLADADLLDDGFYVNPNGGAPIADNAAMVLNAMDNLAGDEALVALRSRAPAARPMARIDALRAAASQKLYSEQAALEQRLQATEDRLAELEAARIGAGQRMERADEAKGEIEAFRAEALQIRGRLRAVERAFRQDIDAVEGRLELLNIWLPPMLVALAGVIAAFLRGRRQGAAP